MAFDAERPQENQGRKPGLLQTLEGKFRQDPFSDRRAAVEAGKGRSQRYIKPELSRMVKKLNASYWKRPLGWDIFNAFVRQLNAVVEKYQISRFRCHAKGSGSERHFGTEYGHLTHLHQPLLTSAQRLRRRI